MGSWWPESSGRDRGASVVEFALILPVLLWIVVGILEYGVYFSDSLSVRQGVREAARSAVVQHENAPSCLSQGTGPTAAACQAKAQLFTIGGGTAYARVFSPHGWVQGQELVVCAVVADHSVTGLVPLPSGGMVKTETTMSIESASPPPSNPADYTLDADPTGGGWSWCTA